MFADNFQKSDLNCYKKPSNFEVPLPLLNFRNNDSLYQKYGLQPL
jgi:hypothetical protein